MQRVFSRVSEAGEQRGVEVEGFASSGPDFKEQRCVALALSSTSFPVS